MQCNSIFNEDDDYSPGTDFHGCRLAAGHIANGVSLEHKCHCGVMWFNNHYVVSAADTDVRHHD